MDMEITYKGYLPVLRAILLFFHPSKLDLSELGWYLMFAFEADWDKRHKKYSSIKLSTTELSKKTGYDTSTITRHLKKLQKAELLIRKKDGVYINNFALFENKVVKALQSDSISNLHSLLAKMHQADADLHSFNAIVHEDSQEKSNSLYGSYKGNISLSNSRTFDKSDEDWITENVKENY